MVIDDINRLNDVDMPECHAHTELRGNLALIILLCFGLSPRSEIFHGIRRPALLLVRLDQPHRPACTGPQHLAPLAVLFGEMGLSCLVQRRVSERDHRIRYARVVLRVSRRRDARSGDR